MQHMTVSVQDDDGVVVIRLAGELLLPDVPPLMRQLTASLTSGAHQCVICDLGDLAAPMSHWLLSVFPATLRRAGGWPTCSLRLAAPSAELLRCLGRLRMHRFLPIHRTLEEALRQGQLDAGPPPYDFTLPPDPGELTRLRSAVRELWPYPGSLGRDETELVTDELATNAIRHVGSPFTVAVAFRPAQTLVAVTDGSRCEPRIGRAGREAASGRGIEIVSQLSRAWGVRLVHGHGKTVWAVVPVLPPTSATAIPRRLAIPQGRSAAG